MKPDADRRDRKPSTYAQHLRIRRENNRFARSHHSTNPQSGEPIPGERSAATIARKARSRVNRARRNQLAAEAAAALRERKAA